MAFNKARRGVLAAVGVGASELTLDAVPVQRAANEVRSKSAFLVGDESFHRTKEADPGGVETSKVLWTCFVAHPAGELVPDVLVDEDEPDLIPKKEEISLDSLVEVCGEECSDSRLVEW